MNIGELKPYPKNAKRHSVQQIDLIARSIREFGFRQPIVIDKNKEIIIGHARLEAAKKLGLKEVPVIDASDLTPQQVKALRLADNKLAELAQWDKDYQQQSELILHGTPDEYDTSDGDFIMYGWTKHDWYGGRKQGNVWHFDKPIASILHPTMKPVMLCAKAITNSSRSEGLVLDLFLGGGAPLSPPKRQVVSATAWS